MKRADIVPILWKVVEQVEQLDLSRHDHHFFAFVEFPEIVHYIEIALTPWYKKIWWRIREWHYFLGIDDDIPF